jgi:RNA-directed DNA polymerase
MPEDTPVNTGDPLWPDAIAARERVLGIQAKLHRWATDDPSRRFDDLYNLVCDPAFLAVAWHRVKGNRGARSAGVDGATVRSIEAGRGVAVFLSELRAQLKARTFVPLPVRERMIPKRGGRKRRLGIPAVRDRVAQAAVKLVLEPILEAGFQPTSYGFRPNRSAHDAIADIYHLAINTYEWVFEADIEACFDTISHTALVGKLRERVADRRVLALVKAFLKAGILAEDGATRDTITGTPQGGILSPLLANLALSVLDDHFAEKWRATGETSNARNRWRRKGNATYRLVRYADDFVVMVSGIRAHAEAIRDEVAAVLVPMGLRLSEAKTRVAHIDEGFDFLSFRIQRKRKRGTERRYLYTYPSKAALAAVKAKVKALSRQGGNQPLAALLPRINGVLRGWTTYFRYGVSSATFSYLQDFTWHRVAGWLRRKHPRANWTWLRRRYLPRGWPTDGAVVLFHPESVHTQRYRFRGGRIPSPWDLPATTSSA